MRCPECQHEHPAGQKCCGACGARLTTGCPARGATNPPGLKPRLGDTLARRLRRLINVDYVLTSVKGEAGSGFHG